MSTRLRIWVLKDIGNSAQSSSLERKVLLYVKIGQLKYPGVSASEMSEYQTNPPHSLIDKRIVSMQALGASGACHMGALFLKLHYGPWKSGAPTRVYIPAETWGITVPRRLTNMMLIIRDS